MSAGDRGGEAFAGLEAERKRDLAQPVPVDVAAARANVWLRPRREKVFGPPPEHHLDGNAKARVWAAAALHNARQRQPGEHQGPLTWATLRVLRALLFRFHGADGGGRCFPCYEKIAAAARCARSSVAVALRALEDAGLLTWVHRLARIRRRERDLFGRLISVWQIIRVSNGYRFDDPLDREPGRNAYKSENPPRPQNIELKKDAPVADTGITLPPDLAAALEGLRKLIGGASQSHA